MDKEVDNFGLLKPTIVLRNSPKNLRRATNNLGTGSQCYILFAGLDYTGEYVTLLTFLFITFVLSRMSFLCGFLADTVSI